MKLSLISFFKGLLPESPGANIREFWLTILNKAKRPQSQSLSPKGEFRERSSAQALFAGKQTLGWSKIAFQRAKGDSGNSLSSYDVIFFRQLALIAPFGVGSR